jgi:hypothetical protein
VYGRLLRAQIYMDGLGVPPDLPRAIEILEEAERLEASLRWHNQQRWGEVTLLEGLFCTSMGQFRKR